MGIVWFGTLELVGPSRAEYQQSWDVPVWVPSIRDLSWNSSSWEKDGVGVWKRLLDGENTVGERVPARLPRASLFKGEEEKDHVVLGEKPRRV